MRRNCLWLGRLSLLLLLGLPRPAVAQDASYTRLTLGGTAPCTGSTGTGSPNSVVTGSVCDWYLRTDGGASTVLYVKETGTASTTGWVAYGTPSGVPSGATLPGTCAIGAFYILTTTGVASTCTATNTWTALGSGGGNLTGPITSVGAATAIAAQTGTGTTFAMAASPTFTGTVTAPTFAGALTGNASTATTLATARALNGTTFDGSAPITVPVPSGATLPGTCAIGQLFTLTTTGVASTCTATNTWTAVGGGIGATGATLPGTCTVGQLFVLTTTGVASTCTSTNTWTTLAGGGGSGTVTATAGALTARAVVLGASGTDTRVVAGLGTSGQVLTSNGSSADPTFQAASGGGGSGGTAGPLSGWTGMNTGADWTAADANGGVAVTIAYNASTNWRFLTKAVPSTPYIASFHSYATLYQNAGNPMSSGVYFSDGTKFEGIELYTLTSGGTPAFVIRVLKSNDVNGTGASVPASLSVAATTMPYGMTPSNAYLQLANDGTNLTWSWSLDGQVWTSLFAEAVGAFITPTTYGFGGINAANAATGPAVIWMRDVTVTP
jgi:hypothetical protein